jgi:tRNA-specific 2-thiouridylase
LDADGIKATIKVRSTDPGADGRVRALGDGRAEVLFDRPARSAAPGQAAVFYDGARVLGGGWIERQAAP